MKKSKHIQITVKITFIISLFFVCNNVMSQWTAQTSNTSSQLNSISFYDANSGFCVGNQVILRTTTGGSVWNSTIMSTDFQTVHFVASSLAYCAGGNVIYKWNGSSWSLHYTVSQYLSLTDIYFVNSLTGYVMGNGAGYGYIMRSTNAGNNWTEVGVFTGLYYGMKFLDANTGFICGDNKRIQRTTNGGDNWTAVLNPGSGTEPLRGIEIVNNKGFAVGDDGIRYTTSDNGLTWVSANVTSQNDFKDAAIWSNGPSTVWAAVGTSNPSLLISASNNFGANWFGQGPPSNNTLRSVCNGQNAWTFYTCGYSGVIYKTTNSGGNFVGIQNISETAENYSLSQNYPNPFNPSTVIHYDIPKQSFTKLVVYDILGKEIAILVNEQLNPGSYEVSFDAGSLSSGMYFYKLSASGGAGEFVDVKKMILIK